MSTDRTRITPDPDGDGVILHLPEITHLDTQVWAVDIGLTAAGLRALRVALAADPVVPVSSPPADRAAVLHAAADELEAQLAQLFVDWPSEPRNSPGVRSWKEAVDSLRRLADEAPAAAEPSPDVDPVYDPRAWEMYRRDAGCGCTAPAPVDCKVPHGTGAWLCVCHRLAGSPPVTDPGKPLAVLGTGKHFTEPNRCVSTDGIFRCARPTGHPGGHRTGRTFWPRRAEGETQSAATPPPA